MSRAERRVQAKFSAKSRKFSCRKAGSARLRIEKIGGPGKAELFWGGRTDGGQGRHREAGRLRFSQNRAVSIKTVKLVRSNSAPVFCAMRRFRIWVGEPLGAPAGEDADREGALIRPLRGTSPLGEKGSGGRPGVPPLRQETDRERWFGSGRRKSGIAPVPIFLLLRPPVGPDGTAPKHS